MKEFAYIIRYGVVGSILWQERGFYKVSFFHEGQNKVEIFIASEIKLRSTDGYEEMSVSEIKRFIKSNRLRQNELDNFSMTISKFDRADIYVILENLKLVDVAVFENLKKILEDNHKI